MVHKHVTLSMFVLLVLGIIAHALIGMITESNKKGRLQKTSYLTVCPQDVRRRYIEEVCRKRNLTKQSIAPDIHLYVDHRHKLAYCLIPKVASRTMRTIIGSAVTRNKLYDPETRFLNVEGISAYNDLSPELQNEVMQKYKKLLVVRHPYDRIRSVVESKFRHRAMIIELLGKNVDHVNQYLSRIRGKDTKFDPTVDNLSFEEFAGILSSEYDKGFRNNHWVTMFERCSPCAIHYDLVLRLETLEKDYRILSSYLRPPKQFSQSAPYQDNMKSSVFDPEEKLFNLLWIYEDLDQEVLDGIRKIYKYDLEVFGYSWNDEAGANCHIPLTDGRYCC